MRDSHEPRLVNLTRPASPGTLRLSIQCESRAGGSLVPEDNYVLVESNWQAPGPGALFGAL